jgi:Ca2+-binding RTX toxin-like protein
VGDSWTNVNGVETLAFTGANTNAISVTPSATAWAAGLRNITYAGDSSATGTNVIDASSNTTATVGLSLIGAGGIDQITGGSGNDTITGLAGLDVIVPGAGSDTIVFNTNLESPGSIAANTTATADNISAFISATDKISIGASGAIDFLATATAVVTAVTFNNCATFAALVTAIGNQALSTTSVAQILDVTLTGTGLAAAGTTRLLIVNDGTAAYAATDLTIQLVGASSAAVVAGDFTFF